MEDVRTQLRDQGYVVLRGVFERNEMAALRAEGHALLDRLLSVAAIDATWESGRAIEGAEMSRLLHCHDVQFHSAAFTRLLLDPRLVSPLVKLVGPNVELHHTKLFIKPPRHGSPFPMHQDHPYFPHARHSVLAAIVHLDDAPLEKGCVRVLPGSHRNGPLPHESEGNFHLPLETYPIEAAVPIEAEAGDVLIFSYLTVHGSGINRSDEARTTCLVQVRDPSDEALTDQHRSRGQGMMLAGVHPGRSSPTGA